MSDELAGKKILIVDDDRDILAAIDISLSDKGAHTLTASDGNTAVRLAEEEEPDLVVLDMMLPRKSGFLVMERIRQRRVKAKSDLPYVIMVTGNPGQRHKQYAQSLGVNEYLNKPFRMDRLLGTITKLLDVEKKEKA